MSVLEYSQIDAIACDKGDLSLLIADGLDWAYEVEHIQALEKKIEVYLLYLYEGNFIEEYPDEKINNIVIIINFAYEPTDRAKRYINKISKIILERSSVKIVYETHGLEGEDI